MLLEPQDGIDHLAHVGGARTAPGFGRGNEQRQESPFRLSEIRGITLPHPVPSTPQVLRGPTSYHATFFQTGSHCTESAPWRWQQGALQGQVIVADTAQDRAI